MAEILKHGNVDLLSGKVAVIGYGSQGHAHALNLADSGVTVEVGLRETSSSWAAAEEAGLTVRTVADAVNGAQLVAILVPDGPMPEVYKQDVEPNLAEGAALLFAHGLNVHFGRISPAAGHDVVMIAPKGPGHIVRRLYEEGYGTPAILAVHTDASGEARELALAYGAAIGAGRAGIVESTFAEETESDLFGEQAVLCGGLSQLVTLGFETLVEAGYQPEIAYWECVNELKLIVDLIYEGGLSWMRYSVSDTAEWGDYTSGPRVVDERTRETMHRVLTEIQDGSFAQHWIAEADGGFEDFLAKRRSARSSQLEEVGRELRKMMPWLHSEEKVPPS